jgi:hypothetical protein
VHLDPQVSASVLSRNHSTPAGWRSSRELLDWSVIAAGWRGRRGCKEIELDELNQKIVGLIEVPGPGAAADARCWLEDSVHLL